VFVNPKFSKMRTTILAGLLLGVPILLAGQIDFSEKHRIDAPIFNVMDQEVKKGSFDRITSILISRKGKLVYEKYYNDTDSLSMHNTRSATKSLATLLMGIAIQQGYIRSEKDSIFKYIRLSGAIKNPDPRKLGLTIEDLLTMSSLLECDDSNPFSRGNEERMYLIEDWLQFFVDLPIRSFTFGPSPAELPYGRSMSYCSAGAAALAEVIQAAIHAPLDEFASEFLLKPLNIRDYQMHYTPTGILNTAGGSEYRSRDLLKMIQLMQQQGRWNNRQLISSAWVSKATTPKVNAREGIDYGYLLWLRPFGKEKKYNTYAMAGNGGQKILAIPELQVSVVITTTNYGNRNAHDYTDKLMDDYIIPALEQ
jgi:CubicO group peptidase (beta-lactamase class C family)